MHPEVKKYIETGRKLLVLEYAELCGAMGIRVEVAEDLEAALSAARDYNGPAMVEVMTDALLV